MCGKEYSCDEAANLCECGLPLYARYNLEKASSLLKREDLKGRVPTMWRYHELLPLKHQENIITLGEGFTPLFRAERLGSALGCDRLYLKDESMNPTGSFKARGLSVAVSKAKELGLKKLAIPSAGNAAGALSAYASKGGLSAYVFMPKDVPSAFLLECQILGAEVTLIDGLITDAGRIVAERKEREGWFDVSTLKEPYRVEGKKTMGYELAEQLNWELPDVIIYPTGGGTGLVGMWKAFQEMEEMGWIGRRRPRMISVQSDGCAPIVRAFLEGKERADEWQNAATIAAGLRVPKAVGDFLMLRAIRESGGTAIAVSDEELLEGVKLLGKMEGIFGAPEAGATVATLSKLREGGLISQDERIVLFITGSGLKYVESLRGVTL